MNIKTTKMLRGVAILIVVASHYAEWMYVEAVRPALREVIATLGPIGVTIFFLMSGYGLTKSAYKGEQGGKPGSGINVSFVLKRLFAVYVPYLIIDIGISIWDKSIFEGPILNKIVTILIGHDYWYMHVILFMYVAFMIIWRIGHFREVLITAAIIGITVYYRNIGRADFWELSNMAFIIGILAASAEVRLGDIMRKRLTQLLLLFTGLVGTVICTAMLYRVVVYDASAAFGWELAQNICFAIFVLGVGYLIPTWKGYILTTLGSDSLFIYLLHTVLFWQIIFKFEAMSYLKACAITALISIVVAVALGRIYALVSKWIRKVMIHCDGSNQEKRLGK